jgi:hypothetical protein
MNEQEPIYNQAVLDMFTVANEYCIFIESAEKYPRQDIYQYLLKVLPLLYLKGATLPLVTVEYPEANERYVTEEQWQVVFNNLRNNFGEDDIFFHSNEDSESAESLPCSMAEKLADIYQDMKDFVLLFSKEIHAARENAVHEIARLFKSHWGSRVLNCQLHLHFLLYESFMKEEDI